MPNKNTEVIDFLIQAVYEERERLQRELTEAINNPSPNVDLVLMRSTIHLVNEIQMILNRSKQLIENLPA